MLVTSVLLFVFQLYAVSISIKGAWSSSSSGGSSNEYTLNIRSSDQKYSARQNRQSIPSLASLFNIVTYWDKNNASSPCSHVGKKRDLECKKVITFDRAGYDKSIEDMKKLILSRLNLDHEPVIKLNKNTMSFIDQLENRILNGGEGDGDGGGGGGGGSNKSKQPFASLTASAVKTKYDMKTPQNRVFNIMNEAARIDVDCLGENDVEPSLCIYFEIPLKNFLNRDMTVRNIISADLWLYVKSMSPQNQQSEQSTSESSRSTGATFELINYHHPSRISLLSSNSLLAEEWNTIDLAPLFVFPNMDVGKLKHSTLNFTLLIRCLTGCRRMQVASPSISSSSTSSSSSSSSTSSFNEDDDNNNNDMNENFETSNNNRLSNSNNNNNRQKLVNNHHNVNSNNNNNNYNNYNSNSNNMGEFEIVVENRAGKKPLLSLNVEEKEELATLAEIGKASKQRAKRKTNGHQEGNYPGGNFRAKGLDKNKYTPKLCQSNYLNQDQECCLVTYYVSFNSLKWASWIISPSGFVANYCSGKCYDKTSRNLNSL